MPSEVDFCNMALSHIGSDAVVAAIDPPDGSVEAGHCARFYPIARAELIEENAWGFARRRVALAEVTNPSDVWAYAYALPSSCLKPLRVLNSNTLSFAGFVPPISPYLTASEQAAFDERGSAEFDIENGVLLTNEPNAVLLYLVDVIDTSRFTPSFNSALSYRLASFLAGPLIKGREGAETAKTLRQVSINVGSLAKASDANSGSEPANNSLADSTRARL